MAATPNAVELAKIAGLAAEDKIASSITALDVSGQLALTDVFVIVSAPTERQVGAIVDEIEDKLRERGNKPLRREGEREGRWVLIDFGDIVVHVQHDEEKEFYELERLWKDCPVIDLGLATGPAGAPSAQGATDSVADES
ncbi:MULTISPECIES: ribosome silencing factor [unclassified Janibacter]|uniref:ribosome silencing factor n=1 Tax=unclassified Janibacter TaxID=2649294 RepID=UPI003D073683